MYNQQNYPPLPSSVSIDQKIDGLKREFDTAQQKMSLTGFSVHQSYLMNKYFHATFEDTCKKFKVEQDDVLKKSQEVFNTDVMLF